jgi:hypothetical protein
VRVAYIGNFNPPFSTENDIAATLFSMGHAVVRLQEDEEIRWLEVLDDLRAQTVDVVLWTRTKSLAAEIDIKLQLEMLYVARLNDIPTSGFHLDRWWGLDRQEDIFESPFFRCEHVYTPDNHHFEQWKAAGVNHHWMPPAIAPHNVHLGEPRDHFRSRIAFVGSWQGGYHREWRHRSQLVHWLQGTYGNEVRLWPRRGEEAIRGRDLADLYASVDVIVGDSCLAPGADGLPMTYYCSDRIPETLGRCGFLLHPYVEGITDGLWQSGKHLMTWAAGDWEELRRLIDETLAMDPDQRMGIAQAGWQHTGEHHTYRNRLEDILALVPA